MLKTHGHSLYNKFQSAPRIIYRLQHISNSTIIVLRGFRLAVSPPPLVWDRIMGSTPNSVPHWNVNVPESEWTDECPEFLANLNTKDLGIISTPDSEYHIETWPEVVQKCKDNRLDLFQRVPSDLRRYLAYNWKLKQEYGSVMNFVLSQRLGWTEPIVPRGRPFEFDEDIKVLWNDWPYGIDERIVHLVVWTKFDLEEDPTNGDLTDKARAEIDAFVDKFFSPHLAKDHVRVTPPSLSHIMHD